MKCSVTVIQQEREMTGELRDDNARYHSILALLEESRNGEAFERCQAYVREGSTDCRNLLAWMYHAGVGVTQDLAEAEQLYLSTALAGSSFGAFYLGKLKTMQRRHDEALRWYEEAAVKDYAPAIYRMGMDYKNGRGVAVDYIKSKALFERAASLGHVFARRELALAKIRGAYGPMSIPKGVCDFIANMWNGVRIASHDLRDNRLLT